MRRWLLIAAAVVCVLTVAATRKPHVYEFSHFWLGAKYFPELRYTGLYGALTASLEERYGSDWLRQRASRVRNLSTGSPDPLGRVLADFQSQRSRWSPGRWQEFGSDVAVLKEAMERYAPAREERLWREIFLDHGNNFPPTWVAYVHLLTRRVPLTPATLVSFAAIDALLLLGVVVAGGALGGLTGAVAALVFLATATTMMSYATWSLCRLDWLAALAGALLLLSRGRWAAAGALWGLSAALKIFPGPLAFLFATAWFAGHRKEPGARSAVLKFLAGWTGAAAAVASGATAVLTAVTGLSPVAIWQEYGRRLGEYAGESRMVNRIGVQALAEAVAERVGGPAALAAGLALAAALAVLLLAVLARGGRPAACTAAVNLLFAPLLFSLNHYYYLLLVLPLAAGGREVRWLAVALPAINLGTAAARAAGVPALTVLEAESAAYSLVLAAVGPVLAIHSTGDSGTMAPAMNPDNRLHRP